MKKTNATIFEFPKDRIVRSVQSKHEEIEKMKAKSLRNYADALSDEMIDNLIGDFDGYGVDVDTDSFTKDLIFLKTALTASIYRSVGMEHPMHPLIDRTVTITKIPSE